ncbi:two component transcriptional regulator, LuxR family [Sphingomonas sp. OV641]|jgi:two-component system response regulator FixJ|uniref:DNA-binding response regulator n=6 Tax=Sphingomonadaceae TaxID=41297 RepID=A0A2A4FPH3_9SPHN|nr:MULTISPECIES: response regulator [Sphingomonadaceae]EZP67890.1 Chemotaxis protein CheY [Sphingomonas paucimobilis]AJR26754.1 response regulator FixJ [Sphingobium sp. YBL2]ALR22955.1 two-component system response regulator [Sphingobium baderi]ATE67678.1 DNA-binding response regulator [Rhizorhabdus dicambivorans]MBB4151630.1 two-component system response regulator FixJ [Sphingobium scionense]
MGDRRIIHLVDDEESIRKAASFALKTAGYDVIAYTSGVEFLRTAKSAEVGCVILDVRMPEMDGLQVQTTMAARGINMPVIVLTGHGDVSVAVQAMKGGAIDFLEKPFEKAALLEAVRRAFARLDDVDLRALESSEAEVRVAALTPREQEVLEGLANGLPNKTIAYDLGCSSRTVEVHRASLMAKLEVRNLSEALRIAFAAGFGRKT